MRCRFRPPRLSPGAAVFNRRQQQHCYRTIESIDGIQLGYGYLTFRVRTADGPDTFVMRWNQASVQDFGASGRVLLDVEDNRYLVADVGRLTEPERALFERFVYW